jgi:hypothetical protein
MTIHCRDIEQFLNIIDGLVRRGLTFSANTNNYEITLTGGF